VLGGDGKLTLTDLFGCCLQLISVIFSNLARVVMMTSEGILTKGELIQSQNYGSLLFCIVVGISVGGWGVWEMAVEMLTTNMKALVTFIFLSGGIFTLAAIMQVGAVRKMGASTYGSYSGLRVLVCVVGGYLWIDEPIASWVEWVGILVVVNVLTVYLRNKAKK